MQRHFYVSHNSQDLGPFTREEIELKVQRKELFPSDFIYMEDVEDWILISEFLNPKKGEKKEEKKEEKKTEKVEPKVEAKVEPKIEPKIEHKVDPKLEAKKEFAPKHSNTPVPTSKLNKEEGPVRFSHGEAKVVVRNEKAGTVSVEIVDSKKLGLEVVATEIRFVAGPASSVTFDGPNDVQVGLPIKLTFRAQDKFGNLDTKFDGTVKLEAAFPVEGLGEVSFKNGVGSKDLKFTKAEAVEFKMSSTSHPTLDLRKTHKVQFKPAPACKVLVESPSEVRAGEEASILVKAVDQYGNLDVNFSETVTVRLSGVMTGDQQVQLNGGTGMLKVTQKHVG